MEEYKVLLTTSGLGSRLGNLTKFTNKSLVRIGDKPTISHKINDLPEIRNDPEVFLLSVCCPFEGPSLLFHILAQPSLQVSKPTPAVKQAELF